MTRRSVAQVLLEHGANINAQDELGITPLMAWFYGYNYHGEGVQLKTFYDNTKSLLRHKGIDFTLTDKNFNRSVVHLMACFAPWSLLDIVLKGKESHDLLEARDVDGLTPLHHAAMFCNYDMISYLIKNGANVNAQSYSLKLTPLMIFFAIHQHNQSSHIHWLEHCNTMMLGRFIDTDISNTKNSSKYCTFQEPGWIAQFRKSKQSSFAPLINLFSRDASWTMLSTDNADLTLSDRFGNTLLHSFIKSQYWKTKPIADLARSTFGKLDSLWNHRNAKGETPFHLLLRVYEVTWHSFPQFAELINKHKIDILLEDNKGVSALELLLTMPSLSIPEKLQAMHIAKKDSIQVPKSVPSQHKKSSQKSYLHSVLQARSAQINLNLVQSIVTHFESEINAQDDDGNTPLMALLQRYFGDAPHSLRPTQPKKGDQNADKDEVVHVEGDPRNLLPFMEYLITCPDADLNIQNNAGDTALHIVCRYFHVGALEAMLCNLNSFEQASKYCLFAFKLLAGGAQATIKNNAGETALDYAPMLMHHYQHVYPRIKDYKPHPRTTTDLFKGPYDLSDFDRD